MTVYVAHDIDLDFIVGVFSTREQAVNALTSYAVKDTDEQYYYDRWKNEEDDRDKYSYRYFKEHHFKEYVRSLIETDEDDVYKIIELELDKENQNF